MPLPAGFKVNGASNSVRLIPPRVQKIIATLEHLPPNELITSAELSVQTGLSFGGAWTNHPAVLDYREKIDGKLFWGSRKSIVQLRKKLEEPEETQNENQ